MLIVLSSMISKLFKLISQNYSLKTICSPLTTHGSPVTSDLPAFLGSQVIFDRKLYREVV